MLERQPGRVSLDLHEIRSRKMPIGKTGLQIFRRERPEDFTALQYVILICRRVG